MIALLLLLTLLLSGHRPLGQKILRDDTVKPRQELTVCPAQRVLRVRIDDGDRIVSVRLIESSAEFLHISERTRSEADSGLSKDREIASSIPSVPCFYQGSVEGEDGLVMAKQRNGWISGTFHYARSIYEIPEQVAPTSADSPLLTGRRLPPLPGERTCGVQQQQQLSQTLGSQERRRQLARKLDTRSNYPELRRKYIKLILIGDHSFYVNQSSNMTRALDRLWEIANNVNGLYKQLGVSVLTVHTEVWTADPYTLTTAASSSGVNASELLALFMRYRMQSLGAMPHSAAHLVSALKFAGAGNVGLANVGKICTFQAAGGVNSDQEANSYGVSVTVAHELGHNLGLLHDEDEKWCNCPNTQGCVMSGVGKMWHPLQFAPCSVNHFLQLSAQNSLGYCMSDPPSHAAVAGTRVFCGNKVVDPGEDCDCGQANWCDNKCCNHSTCNFTAGAFCASGECCDTNSCTVKARDVICRAVRGVCDLPEYCNGSSEWCPFDDYKVDGTECLAGKVHCYNGQCNDRDQRCTEIFPGYNVTSAPESWTVATTRGTPDGYCSYTESGLDPLTYSYAACTVANMRCGLLYCIGVSTAVKPKWMGLDQDDTGIFNATVGGVIINSAAYARLNLKHSGYRDPGLVPDGAKCGTNLMCVDSQCVPASPPVICPNCNGSCAQSGLCVCQDPHSQPPGCQVIHMDLLDINAAYSNQTPNVTSGVAAGLVSLPGLLIAVTVAHCLCWPTFGGGD